MGFNWPDKTTSAAAMSTTKNRDEFSIDLCLQTEVDRTKNDCALVGARSAALFGAGS
jgi:hypothetical protein